MAAVDQAFSATSPSSMEEVMRPRRPWLASLLSLVGGGPVGQVYAGALRRCIVLWIIGVVLVVVVFLCAVHFTCGRTACVFMFVCSVGYRLFVVADAWRVAARRRFAFRKVYQQWWIYLLMMAAFHSTNWLVAIGVKNHVAEAFVVTARAMADTILPGDRILVDKICYRAGPIKCGDVIVFRSAGPGSPPFVMRVVGVGGQQIEIRNEKVHLDGEPLDEPYAKFEEPMPPFPQMSNFGPVRIPDDAVFVLGDNRRLSNDSRLLGMIPVRDVLGKACFIYWSPRCKHLDASQRRDSQGRFHRQRADGSSQ